MTGPLLVPITPPQSIAVGGPFTGGGTPVPKQIFSRVFSVTDFGGIAVAPGGNPSAAIVNANDQAFAEVMGIANLRGGGVVYCPGGIYFTSQDIAGVPLASDAKAVIIRGDGMRASYIYPTALGQAGIRLGPAVPDLSGDTTHNVQ